MMDFWDCKCSNTESLRAITHNGVGTINPCLRVALSFVCTPISREIPYFLAENGRPLSVVFFKERSESAKLENGREWQVTGREYSSLRSNGLLVLWGKGVELSKKRDQEGLEERKRLLLIFLFPAPIFFFFALVPSTFPRFPPRNKEFLVILECKQKTEQPFKQGLIVLTPLTTPEIP